jgi:glycosyltransferase involved in cell wall biosynthesis
MSTTEGLVSSRISYKPPTTANRETIRILCAQSDVIGKIGGGEAASVRMLGRIGDALATWPVSQQPRSELGPHFECASIDTGFRSAVKEQLRAFPDIPGIDRVDFAEALTIARAVKGREFDIVECPDYLTYGRFLPFALAECGVKYKHLVCSLHGRASRTFEIENQFADVHSATQLEQLRTAERQFIFGTADIRYAFSERYAAQTKSLKPLPVVLVDPLCALPDLQSSVLENQRRSRIWFVARQDRVKGADLFLAAIFRAGPAMWDNYVMCGPSVRLRNRVSIFEAMSFCRWRGMPFRYRGPLPYTDVVRDAYRGGGLIVIPSREETFSLVALEALLNGAPVLISKYAGATDFIRNRFGNNFAGAVEFDPFDEFASAAAIQSTWDNWEEHRSAVISALRRVDLDPRPDQLWAAYWSTPHHDPRLRDEAADAWDRALRAHATRPASVLTNEVESESRDQAATLPSQSKFKLADKVIGRAPKDQRVLSFDQGRRLAELSPYTNRARIYRNLALCEETSRPSVAAAYRLRAFRMNLLPPEEMRALPAQLHDQGLLEEETCFRLWSSRGNTENLTHYLDERQCRLLKVDLKPCEYTVDRRNRKTPKVSVIVSMYNASSTVLEHFIAHLSAVGMVHNGAAEVIFVDSGSTTPQLELLRAIPKIQQISWVVVRSVHRETIQTAWNRGLQAARGEYITCLGVDEGLTESSLDDLAQFLDEHTDVDWVTGNTVITQVDAQGRWKRDVMGYERSPYSHFHYLLDCTYINYVGGLYRRSIHSRFGWYDGSFKGAGDTEFKCRMFRYIQTAALPKTLGFYFDFPSPRVTNSANIEVEDLRAWYVFRTPGGLEYIMRDKDIAAWEDLFWLALSGHRSWSISSSDCDLSLAANVLAGILQRNPGHPLRVLARRLEVLVREMRRLQDWQGSSWLGTIAELDLIERSHTFFKKCANMRPDLSFPSDFRADALFFAHNWTWPQ